MTLCAYVVSPGRDGLGSTCFPIKEGGDDAAWDAAVREMHLVAEGHDDVEDEWSVTIEHRVIDRNDCLACAAEGCPCALFRDADEAGGGGR